ncbi:sensor histidine kinase [Oleiharenicola lentus]|uniref:histidine kinase n=1 Tax=Oleiharenicola lentus TaxID=2508720 RepID=A0A4Q1C8D7_9BACT|nr:sensor histidine kinase [Oleiharenicola lentus]RXK55207.1 sensor histidine kinase [Oleiharenicola lentus]
MDIWPKDRGTYYGSFAFASVVLGCYAGYFNTRTFYTSEWMALLSFVLGAVHVTLGIFCTDYAAADSRRQSVLYFLGQCALLTVILLISPIRGFMGVLVLPVVSQSVLLLGWRGAALVTAYLYGINVALWGVPYGWGSALQALISYSAGFAFTVVFTAITRQALEARHCSEKLRHELEKANLQLRAQAAQTEELATTRERNRVAREIHDGVGHYLTVVKTQLDAASALLPAQPDRAREAVGKAAKLAAEALDDVRRSVGTLRTDATRPPLPEALKELAAHGEPAPTLAIEGEPRPLAPGVEHALFRAAQEGLTNIRKHARATNALLRLDFRTPQRVVLELADNGVGANGANGTGFGLRGLRERIELLGGTVASGNRLEGGFALRVEVPA